MQLTPVDCVRIIIEDARKEEKVKHDYDVLHRVFVELSLETKEIDVLEHLLGYRDDNLQLKDEFKNEKFRRRNERLKASVDAPVRRKDIEAALPPKPPRKRA